MIKERYQEFTNSQRSQIVWQILARARYDDQAKEKVIIYVIRSLADYQILNRMASLQNDLQNNFDHCF